MPSTSGVFRRVDHNTRPEPGKLEGPASREEKLGRLEVVSQHPHLSLCLRGTTPESDLSNSRKQRVSKDRDEEQMRVVWRQKGKEGNKRQPVGLGV